VTPEQQQQAMRWFEAKAADKLCPVCRSCSWKAEVTAALWGTAGRQQLAPPQSSIEVVVIGCLECGHYLLFSGSILDCQLPEVDQS
jgi:hypothetical protein